MAHAPGRRMGFKTNYGLGFRETGFGSRVSGTGPGIGVGTAGAGLESLAWGRARMGEGSYLRLIDVCIPQL